ncbi:hypothetical protein ACHAPJ_007998 [Fusarium lateritium]
MSWRFTTPGQRRDIFLKAADVIEKRSAELKEYMITETGCEESWAAFNVLLAKECVLECTAKIRSNEGIIPTLQDSSVGGMIVKEPFGVILAMAPWNAPYALGFRAVAGAVAAGNTVVFKGSELSPRTHWAVCSIFQNAGLPEGVLNYITCNPNNAPAVTKAIIDAPAVKKINFTGSSAVGRIIGHMAAANSKPILLELGGKAPAIVCADADIDLAANHCMLGAFMNAGQICMSTERILVHKSIRDCFEAKLKEAVQLFFPSASDIPTLISAAAVARNKALVKDALSKGATILCGEVDATESRKTRLRPCVVSGVKPDMDIYAAESFGPTVSILEFEDEDEALQIANDTEYGLSSAIFSRDLRRALGLARRLETGAVHINRMTVHDEAGLPHGGAKASGYGRFNAGLDEWVRTKNITYDI